jgi:hypothetical protein
MTQHDMIARYAQAVARLLPRAMRADVHAELQALLMDSLRERAAGGAPTEQMATELLVSFGAPRDVALRYHSPAAIVDPADAGLFRKIAFGLLIALGVLAISVILSAPHATEAEWRLIANGVAEDYVRSSLLVLGILFALFWLLGAARRMYPGLTAWKPGVLPPVRDPDQINRLGAVAALAAWALGFLILMQPVASFDLLWGGQAPAALRHAFAYDETFTRERAPLLWITIGAGLLVYAWATVEGRWRKLTRRIDLAIAASIGLASMWIIMAGAIFVAAPTNQAMKFWMALIAGFMLLDVWRRIGEERGEPDAPPMARVSGA